MDGLSAFILAGGKSSRMGTEKGLIPFRGKPLIQHLIATLAELGIKPVIIGHHPEYHQFEISVVGDLIPDKGPMGGIFTALSHSVSSHALILSCDSPLIQTGTLKKLITMKSNSIVVGQREERIYPFPGIYPASILPQVKRYLEENKLKLQAFILDQAHQIIPLDQISSQPEAEFTNFNFPSDLLPWEDHREND
jgi:molybdenum cofactor guanylyltransferase